MSATVQQGQRLPVVRPGTSQNVSISGVSAKVASAFGTNTEMLRVVATSDTWYAVGGSSITATKSDVLLPAGVVEIVRVNKGVDTHLAGIQDAASGTLNVVEIS